MSSDTRSEVRRATSDYFLVYDRKNCELIGRVVDLSRGGMKLVTQEPLPVDGQLEYRLVFPREIGGETELEMASICVWCRENEKVGWYESGHAFCNISPDNKKILDAIVSDLLAGSS